MPPDHITFGRRAFLTRVASVLGTAASVPLWPGPARAQNISFFRIGTASTSGTYFPIGGILANAISHPPGSRPCEQGGSCGVPGLIAVAQSTDGSVDNVRRIARGTIDSGFVQADVAYWAFTGKRLFGSEGPITALRAIANLYAEAIHLVVRADSGITKVADLKGKRISLDQEASGTRVDAKLILDAYGVHTSDLEDVPLPAGQAADQVRAGDLDGFFFVAGAPAKAIETLARDTAIRLIRLSGPEADELQTIYPFFAPHSIPAGTYQNVPHTETLSVGAQWLVGAAIDAETVYRITRALWHPSTSSLLAEGHPRGRDISLNTALKGLGVPLHPGARRYYEEIGVLSPEQKAAMPSADDRPTPE